MVLENALDGIRFSELCGSVFKWACESRIGRQQKWRLELAKVGDDVTAARKEGPAGGRPASPVSECRQGEAVGVCGVFVVVRFRRRRDPANGRAGPGSAWEVGRMVLVVAYLRVSSVGQALAPARVHARAGAPSLGAKGKGRGGTRGGIPSTFALSLDSTGGWVQLAPCQQGAGVGLWRGRPAQCQAAGSPLGARLGRTFEGRPLGGA